MDESSSDGCGYGGNGDGDVTPDDSSMSHLMGDGLSKEVLLVVLEEIASMIISTEAARRRWRITEAKDTPSIIRYVKSNVSRIHYTESARTYTVETSLDCIHERPKKMFLQFRRSVATYKCSSESRGSHCRNRRVDCTHVYRDATLDTLFGSMRGNSHESLDAQEISSDPSGDAPNEWGLLQPPRGSRAKMDCIPDDVCAFIDRHDVRSALRLHPMANASSISTALRDVVSPWKRWCLRNPPNHPLQGTASRILVRAQFYRCVAKEQRAMAAYDATCTCAGDRILRWEECILPTVRSILLTAFTWFLGDPAGDSWFCVDQGGNLCKNCATSGLSVQVGAADTEAAVRVVAAALIPAISGMLDSSTAKFLLPYMFMGDTPLIPKLDWRRADSFVSFSNGLLDVPSCVFIQFRVLQRVQDTLMERGEQRICTATHHYMNFPCEDALLSGACAILHPDDVSTYCTTGSAGSRAWDRDAKDPTWASTWTEKSYALEMCRRAPLFCAMIASQSIMKYSAPFFYIMAFLGRMFHPSADGYGRCALVCGPSGECKRALLSLCGRMLHGSRVLRSAHQMDTTFSMEPSIGKRVMVIPDAGTDSRMGWQAVASLARGIPRSVNQKSKSHVEVMPPKVVLMECSQFSLFRGGVDPREMTCHVLPFVFDSCASKGKRRTQEGGCNPTHATRDDSVRGCGGGGGEGDSVGNNDNPPKLTEADEFRDADPIPSLEDEIYATELPWVILLLSMNHTALRHAYRFAPRNHGAVISHASSTIFSAVAALSVQDPQERKARMSALPPGIVTREGVGWDALVAHIEKMADAEVYSPTRISPSLVDALFPDKCANRDAESRKRKRTSDWIAPTAMQGAVFQTQPQGDGFAERAKRLLSINETSSYR
jgi:hypothetical protein